MEETKDSKSQNEIPVKKLCKNKLLIIGVCLIVLIIIAIILNVFKRSYDNSIYNDKQQSDKNNTITTDKQQYDENNTITNDNATTTNETKIDKEYGSYHIDIAKTNLYVDIQEKEYTNYSRKTKVEYGEDIYFIENNDIYVKHGDEKIKININNERAKYLGEGRDCGGGSVFALTEEGNVYLVNNPGVTDAKEKGIILYDKKDAKEIIPIRESKIFTTCGELSLYVLVDDELYSINIRAYQSEMKIYGTRKETHPFSIAYDIRTKSFDNVLNDNIKCPDSFNMLLFPDGQLNSSVYCGWNYKIDDTFIKNDSGEDLFVSFIYLLEDIVYIVDTEGYVYKVNAPFNVQSFEGGAQANISVEKIKEFNTKVKSIDLDYTLYTESEVETSKWINSKIDYGLKFTFVDGTTQSYSTTDGNNIYFKQYYFSNK